MSKMTLSHISPVFTDERGDIIDILEGEVHHAGLVTFAEGTVRANHYHKKQTQYTYILSGKLEQKTRDALQDDAPVETHILVPGDLVVLPPNTVHAYKALEPSSLLCLTNRERTSESYEEDTIRVPPL